MQFSSLLAVMAALAFTATSLPVMEERQISSTPIVSFRFIFEPLLTELLDKDSG